MKNKILILCNSNIYSSPRPLRMIECLKNEYSLTVLTKNFEISNKDYIEANYVRHKIGVEGSVAKTIKILKHVLSFYDSAIWSGEMIRVKKALEKNSFKYIICHNLTLLPLALKIKKRAKILFDAREYYPRHFEDRLLWKIMYQGRNEYICDKYMPKVEYTITVSRGIMKEYIENYGIKNISVIESLPDSYDLKPSKINNNKIKIVHHGNTTLSRKIEDMIYMMDFVDNRFELDLMLMPTDKKYYKYLQNLCKKRENVRIKLPVKYKDIVPTINTYDIGVFNAFPSTFNLKYTLPNKFFEFIQARLAILIGPSIDMKVLLDKYSLGIYSKNYTSKSMAKALNSLTRKQIFEYKKNANKAAKKLNKYRSCVKIKQIIENL
jgi:hypothetical protein